MSHRSAAHQRLNNWKTMSGNERILVFVSSQTFRSEVCVCVCVYRTVSTFILKATCSHPVKQPVSRLLRQHGDRGGGSSHRPDAGWHKAWWECACNHGVNRSIIDYWSFTACTEWLILLLSRFILARKCRKLCGLTKEERWVSLWRPHLVQCVSSLIQTVSAPLVSDWRGSVRSTPGCWAQRRLCMWVLTRFKLHLQWCSFSSVAAHGRENVFLLWQPH